MNTAEAGSHVEMDVLRGDPQRTSHAQVDPTTPSHPQRDAEASGPASQTNESPDFPGPATKSSLPRIFERANFEDVLRDLYGSCTPTETAEAWSKTADIVKAYSDDMMGKWNSEIDTLLVYAGLFSAILTAFSVESYQLLQPPASDPTHAILERMSAQLRSFSVTTPFINSTEPHYTLATSASKSPAPILAHVWLNILWFSGLICSLASASIGIMVKQWLRELSMRPSGTQQEVARIRQYRLNNLIKWRVAGIVSMLPVMLQLSLILFLSGLLVLLWTLHAAVAAVSSGLVGLLLTFMAATIILPAFKADCCYISPPTHILLPLGVRLRRLFYMYTRPAVDSVQKMRHKWIGRTYAFLDRWLYHAFDILRRGQESSTWSIREVQHVQRRSRDLDVAQIIFAYSLTLQSGYLSKWGRICLLDESLNDPRVVMQFIDGIRTIDERHKRLGLPKPREVEDLEVWLYVLLRLWVSDGRKYNGDQVSGDRPSPPAELFRTSMTHARSFISNSIFWGRADRCRPDALCRTMKILAPISPIIVQDNNVPMKVLVVRLSRNAEFLNTWHRAQYVAQVSEELLQSPDRTRAGLLNGENSFVDLIGVLVACAELKDTPEAVATRMRSLALHEVTHLVHLLHGDSGRALLQRLSPWENKRLAERLQQMHSLERRCRRISGGHGPSWIIELEVEPLPPPFTMEKAKWTDEDRQAARDEVLKRCKRCIPSFRHPNLCPICPEGKHMLPEVPAEAMY